VSASSRQELLQCHSLQILLCFFFELVQFLLASVLACRLLRVHLGYFWGGLLAETAWAQRLKLEI
jgi:hypothetical protein